MKKLLLILNTILGFFSFSLLLKTDWMLSLCVLIFSLIYLFGIIDMRKNPQRIDAHLMVGGAMFLIVMCFVLLRDLSKSQFELSLDRLMVILMGWVGFTQMMIIRKKFR
ncbi:MAG: hypothetical protein WHT65_05210 [Pseudothermotoga sp.]